MRGNWNLTIISLWICMAWVRGGEGFQGSITALMNSRRLLRPAGTKQGLDQDLIKSAELSQVTYDAFNNSIRYEIEDGEGSTVVQDDDYQGSIKEFNEKGMYFKYQYQTGPTLTEYDFRDEYEVVGNIYTTAFASLFNMSSEQDDWQGFIAVSKEHAEESEIVIAWRGSAVWPDWREDFTSFLIPYNESAALQPLSIWEKLTGNFDQTSVRVHKGFLELLTKPNQLNANQCQNSPEFATPGPAELSAQEYIRSTVARLLAARSGGTDARTPRVRVVGHSLGGALAVLTAYDLAASGLVSGRRLAAHTFAAPRPGNRGFRRAFGRLGVAHRRVYMDADLVPRLPPRAPLPLLGGFRHAGRRRDARALRLRGARGLLDPAGLLAPPVREQWAHHLELYLRLLQGEGRDPALLAKYTGMLRRDRAAGGGGGPVSPRWFSAPGEGTWPKRAP